MTTVSKTQRPGTAGECPAEAPTAAVRESLYDKAQRLLYTFRGVANDSLMPELVLHVGRIVGCQLQNGGQGRMLMAGDHRTSTAMLSGALAAGLQSAGTDVVDLGMCPSPSLAFAVAREKCAGVMITASHNPPEWNGLQFLERDSHIYGPDAEEAIKQVLREPVDHCGWEEIGGYTRERGVVARHIQAISTRARVTRPIRVVVDLGNGMAATAIPQLLDELGVSHTDMHAELDPMFSRRPSEPRPEHLGRLRDAVIQSGAQAGFAYDGDCDRFVVLDERGQYVNGDRIMLLLCRGLLRPGELVLNASTSLCTIQELERDGFSVELVRWGQTFMGELVRDRKASFGGEPDGHYIWPELSLRGDAVASTAFFCQVLSEMTMPLSAMVAELPLTHMIDEKIEWEGDLADYSVALGEYGERFDDYQVLHPRLYVMTTQDSKLAVRQSPFDRTLRLFSESYEAGHAEQTMAEVKAVLL